MAGSSGLDMRRQGKKALSFELNLVPFIDLFTCLICFLLMTAVWVSVDQISISNAGSGPGGGGEPKDLVTVLADAQGFELRMNDRLIGSFPRKGALYDFAALGAALGNLKKDAIHGDAFRATMMLDDSVPYQILINLLDVCRANDLEDISVAAPS